MSETFYIKSTAFDDNNFDLTQREADSFIIGPGELNGPGGLAQNSDLELYGFGAIKWGEGVNQNQYRMLENNACPEKVTGDFLVGTDDPDGFVPGTGSFVPNAGSPINGAVPKDKYDLGIGNGITIQLIGQLWYNTTREVLYNYEVAGWTTVFREAINDLITHINDHSVHLRGGQNEFLDGLILGGSPLSLQSHDINQLIGITDVDGTVQDQIDLMVDTRGDTMTGDLILASGVALQTEGGIHRITNNDGGGDFNIRIGHEFDGSEIYTGTNQGAIHLLGAHEGEAPKFSIKLGDTATTTIGNPVAFSGTFAFTNDGNVSASAAVPTAPSHLARKDYTDLKAPISSPTLTGTPRSVTFSSSDNSTRIATTAFVKSQTTPVGRIFNSSSSGSIIVPTGVSGVEITITSGGGGGAAGSDGGNWTGPNGGSGGISTLLVPGNPTISLKGGLGGWATQFALTIPPKPIAGGYGISAHGGVGLLGNPGAGGNGGSGDVGYGGFGVASFGGPHAGMSGERGGGGAGGAGQDHGSGTGGDSGKLYRGFFSVSADATIEWELGGGGAGGISAVATGGAGGSGYIRLLWVNHIA